MNKPKPGFERPPTKSSTNPEKPPKTQHYRNSERPHNKATKWDPTLNKCATWICRKNGHASHTLHGMHTTINIYITSHAGTIYLTTQTGWSKTLVHQITTYTYYSIGKTHPNTALYKRLLNQLKTCHFRDECAIPCTRARSNRRRNQPNLSDLEKRQVKMTV